jgi:hypothetical protein
VNTSALPDGLVWPDTVTRTSTLPLPGGLFALQVVVLEQLTADADVPPKATVVAPAVVLKLVPVIVTGVPPEAGPVVGVIPVTVGTGGPG